MALGHRKPQQTDLFIPAALVVTGPGHPFYTKLNEVLAQAQFDEFVEKLCAPCYCEGGRPSIPPGVYFRMLLVGYFEGIDGQRGIAWRCADSLSLRSFLGVALTEATPVHVSMTMIRQRLPERIFDAVFRFVLTLLEQQGVLRGKTVGIDATTLEANAAMKSIVRKDTRADWNTYLRGLAKAEGMESPSDEDLRRLDRKRKGKKVSNQEWESPTDPDSRITKMKDGRTHLAYKAEHAVDLESEAIVAATVMHADRGDAETGPITLSLAEANLVLAGATATLEEVVMDKGYHDLELLADCAERGVRTYLPQREQKHRCWTDKPEIHQTVFRANRQRVLRAKGRRLNRWRSERCERTFAHVCETGGGRRMWLRGLTNASKVHVFKCAAYNLGLLLRKVWGLSKPRNGKVGAAALFWAILALLLALALIVAGGADRSWDGIWEWLGMLVIATLAVYGSSGPKTTRENDPFLTGC